MMSLLHIGIITNFISFLFIVHFLLTAFVRFVLTMQTNKRIHKGLLSFNTLLVGSNGNALKIYNEMTSQYVASGNRFIGYIRISGESEDMMKDLLPCLGSIDKIQEIVENDKVEELIIAIDPAQHPIIERVLLESNNLKVMIKIMPDYKDIIAGTVKYSAIFNIPLIELPSEIMPLWQQIAKRVIDIFVSVIVMIVFSPLYVFLSIGVKGSSKGPIFYSHERIGLRGVSFKIFKFRSMYVNAESEWDTSVFQTRHDPRVTRFGRFMRKYRLDEIPQFYNVLIGEYDFGWTSDPKDSITLIRLFSRLRITDLLHRVKPGITSWGQVKYGYAENVEQK
jgi:lipopolysaccharide/colanic/teichoic acid biosynthesis glycosyltransferase